MEEEKVDHPKHYNQYPIEVIDMMVSIWGKEKAIDFCIMNGRNYMQGWNSGRHTVCRYKADASCKETLYN